MKKNLLLLCAVALITPVHAGVTDGIGFGIAASSIVTGGMMFFKNRSVKKRLAQLETTLRSEDTENASKEEKAILLAQYHKAQSWDQVSEGVLYGCIAAFLGGLIMAGHQEKTE